jgi:cephalosporin hydroxylase
MKREDIIDLLTESQKQEIKTLQGIGSEQHFLGGPQLAGVHKDGKNIGWGQSVYNSVSVLQTSTDLENWVKIIDKYQPDIFIEMGVANGGNIIYINDLIQKHKSCEFVGIDIEDNVDKKAKELSNFKFLMADTLSEESFHLIKSVVENNKGKRVLMHFDDWHKSDHVLKELNMYSALLNSNDVIIVGDTWDEGWYDSPFQALCDFVENNDSMYIDSDLNKDMIMPCNWIFGILLKK